MLIGNGEIQNVVLLLAGLVLVGAGIVLYRRREPAAQYLRDLRTEFIGERRGGRASNAPSPWIPIVVAVILVGFGVIGIAGGLFATLPPLGTPRV